MRTELSSRPRPSTLASRLGRVCVAGAVVSAVGLASTHPAAHAAGFAVTTTADGGAGSLRDAIDQANANPGPDTITVPAGTYTITVAGFNEDSNATGDFDISDDVTIVGAGAGVTIIDAAGLDRAFDVVTNTTTLQDMTITNGDVGSGAGGNIIERPGANLTVQDSIISNGFALSGGGIYGGSGVMTISRTEIINNTAQSIPGNGSTGGGISKTGGAASTLTVTDSLIANNSAVNGTAAVYSSGDTTITNSTLTGNSSYARTLLIEASGAFSGSSHLVHVTIAGNGTTGNVPGNAIALNVNPPASMAITVEGSLLQDNPILGSPSNCAIITNLGSIVSEGNNLTDDTTCTSLLQPSDQTNNHSTTFAALADNGGPTRTLALVTGSSAIDAAGNCGAATATDQRGIARPQGPACDVGAYEADVVVQPTTTTTTDPGTTTTTDPGTTTTTDPGTTTTTVAIDVTTTTDLGSGGGTTATDPFGFFTTTTVFHGGLPATGTNPANSLWLAALVCSLGGLLILGARRLAR